MKAKASRYIALALVCFGLALALMWAIFLIWGRHFSEATWSRILPGFALAETFYGPTPQGHISWTVAAFLCLLTFAWAAVWLMVKFEWYFQREEVQQRLFSHAISIAVICGLFICMIQTPQEWWYDIKTMMTNPGSVPVFGQRLLLVWPAVLLKHFVPRLSYLVAFKLVQGIAIAVGVYLIGTWSALFVGEMKFVGQVMLAAFMIPTFAYQNAHDIGVLIIYTLCFLFLYKKNYWLYAITFCVGMLNHQNILLLIPTAFVILWGKEKLSRNVVLAAITTIGYFTIQFLLNTYLPIPETHRVKVWWNIRQIVELHQTLIFGVLELVPWYVAAGIAFRSAHPFLKRAAILFPLQLGVFFLYGSLNEARIFNGFLPVLIGILLCYMRVQSTRLAKAFSGSYKLGAESSEDAGGLLV